MALQSAIKSLNILSLEVKLELLNELTQNDGAVSQEALVEMKAQLTNELEKELKKKNKKSSHIKKEKRPLTDYNLFIQEKLKQIKKDFPNEKSKEHMTRAVAMWKEAKPKKDDPPSSNESE